MTVSDAHVLRIARQTIQMSDAMAAVMGGITKDEARAILATHDAAQALVSLAGISSERNGQ
jgi:hypothetical protein